MKKVEKFGKMCVALCERSALDGDDKHTCGTAKCRDTMAAFWAAVVAGNAPGSIRDFIAVRAAMVAQATSRGAEDNPPEAE